ncbi:MAG TPA: 1,4-alpha-glucan branching protein GlgB [Gammaproteobacteria bacterium]|nr:1,4-alpha-glucan branching protein GlgB [Gammaproteobacteria bacterium]
MEGKRPNTPDTALEPELQRILHAQHHNPFAVLGKHQQEGIELVRAYLPGAREAAIVESNQALQRIVGTDLFEWRGRPGTVPDPYRLAWTDQWGNAHISYDPYCFAPQLSEYDIYLFGEGHHWHAYRFLGSHVRDVSGIHGVLFATWAPNAERVSVVGDFNNWDGRRHPMRSLGGSGLWELFIPGLAEGALYKFEIRNCHDGSLHLKSDPYARHSEMRPSTASKVRDESPYAWSDEQWLSQRAGEDWLRRPLSIYEVHLGSWQRNDGGDFLNYRDLAHRLVPYVEQLGFNYIELLPIMEHPFDGSWGYQTTGYYSPTSRFGNPDDFRYFVDYCHRHGIGVLLDWTPGHFPKDQHGLARYDGSALYEHEDPRRGEQRDWGTLIFNYGRNEVKNYLLSNALYWLEEFHVDGLRVDAVASMLYLDYSRREGDWLPNMYGGNENLEAITFLRELNQITHSQHPGTYIIAEESTSWPMVSRPTWVGGLGFSMKWNMGWMHDTLEYMTLDPIYRHYHHDQLTFSMVYAFNENFVLPFSHDEVVHGKRSMLNKMPGDEWQRFANLRLLYTYMFTHPGKKLLFMGNEFGQYTEWNEAKALDWNLLEFPLHRGMQALVADVNRLYCDNPALFYHDFEPQGFEWIDCHDSTQSTLSFARRYQDQCLVVVLNFTPVVRSNYRIGVPRPGDYEEILNSDSVYYGGSNVGNSGHLKTTPEPWMNRPQSLTITLPPLAAVVLRTA